MRTETALIERHHSHVADLQKSFHALDFSESHQTMPSTFQDAENKLQMLRLSEDGHLSRLYREYLACSLRVIEAFVPKTHDYPVLLLYYYGLTKAHHVRRCPLLLDDCEAADLFSPSLSFASTSSIGLQQTVGGDGRFLSSRFLYLDIGS